MEKPDVDEIDGIAPAIAIRQKNSIRNPRSTVGTTTEIHDYMRLLFARVGRTFCRNCGREVVRETAEVVARQLGELPAGTRLLLGFDLPVVARWRRERAAEVDEVDERERGGRRGVGPTRRRRDAGPAAERAPSPRRIENLRRKGFGRLLIDDRAVRVRRGRPGHARGPRDAAGRRRSRAAGRASGQRQRLTDSIETAYLEGGGAAWAVRVDGSSRAAAASRFTSVISSPSASSAARAASRTRIRSRGCSRSTTRSARVRPATASATSSSSTWTWSCPIRSKSIQQGAIEPWSKPHYRAQLAELKRAREEAQASGSTCPGPS